MSSEGGAKPRLSTRSCGPAFERATLSALSRVDRSTLEEGLLSTGYQKYDRLR